MYIFTILNQPVAILVTAFSKLIKVTNEYKGQIINSLIIRPFVQIFVYSCLCIQHLSQYLT